MPYVGQNPLYQFRVQNGDGFNQLKEPVRIEGHMPADQLIQGSFTLSPTEPIEWEF